MHSSWSLTYRTTSSSCIPSLSFLTVSPLQDSSYVTSLFQWGHNPVICNSSCSSPRPCALMYRHFKGTPKCADSPGRARELFSQGCCSSTSSFPCPCFWWSQFILVLLIAVSPLFTPPRILWLPALSTTWYHGEQNQQKFGMPTSRWILTGLIELCMQQPERRINVPITKLPYPHILKGIYCLTTSSNMSCRHQMWVSGAKTEKRFLET